MFAKRAVLSPRVGQEDAMYAVHGIALSKKSPTEFQAKKPPVRHRLL